MRIEFKDKKTGKKYRGKRLGLLLDTSEPAISWENLPLIREVIRRRDDLAHRGKIVGRGDCWKYIDAIEAELVRWEIVTPP